MYIRYELYVDGEPQGVGFLQGLSELDKDDEYLDCLTKPFDENLKLPQSVFAEHKLTESWFTEEGYQKFKAAVANIQQAYDDTGLFEMKCLTAESLDNIVYQDEFQVICKL